MSDDSAKLSMGDQALDCPILKGTLGKPVIDINALGKTGYFTFDPGFVSTAACESKITFIDGEKGVLLYRGYPIGQLAEHADFLETCYLLYNGELPSKTECDEFVSAIHDDSLVHEQITKFFNGFRRDAHPMAIMVGVVGALSAFYHDNLDIDNPEHRKTAAIRLIAKMPTLAAMSHKYAIGEPFMLPKNELGYAENFLQMLFGTPCAKYEPNPVLSDAMDKIFILHADHEQNASTSTVRLAGSTGANPYACISAGIGALWGPRHGGANEAALNMLREIGDVKNIGEHIKKVKNKEVKLMGFGHRVYKSYDPRATVMQKTAHQVLDELGKKDDPILKIAMELEKIALEDEYFIEKKLYPNVDFYSGITLNALGIPANMFTVIFAVARTVGWISHWNEMVADGSRIGRPRQLYTGETERDYK